MKKKKKENLPEIRSFAAEYLTFIAVAGNSEQSFEMRYEDENIWLTQKMMATVYDVDVRTINEHIQKVYADSELSEGATIRNFRIVQTEGSREVSRDIMHYKRQRKSSRSTKLQYEITKIRNKRNVSNMIFVNFVI